MHLGLKLWERNMFWPAEFSSADFCLEIVAQVKNHSVPRWSIPDNTPRNAISHSLTYIPMYNVYILQYIISIYYTLFDL